MEVDNVVEDIVKELESVGTGEVDQVIKGKPSTDEVISTTTGSEENSDNFFIVSEPQKTFTLGKKQRKDLNQLISFLSKQESQNLTDLKRQKISKNIRVSLMEELSLSNYVMTKAEKCIREHKDSVVCTCNNMVQDGKIVLEKKVVALSYLWNRRFSGTVRPTIAKGHKGDCYKFHWQP